MNLKAAFTDALAAWSVDPGHLSKMWTAITTRFAEPHRRYHTIIHLEHVFRELLPHRRRFSSWEAVVFAIAYHDLVYDPARHDNEEASAAYAGETLAAVSVPDDVIAKTKAMILATKHHAVHDDEELNLFTDADLSILGSDEATYARYAQAVRSEYQMYPDALYANGRTNVLKGFLEKGRIFNTQTFATKYEEQARRNIKAELQTYRRSGGSV